MVCFFMPISSEKFWLKFCASPRNLCLVCYRNSLHWLPAVWYEFYAQNHSSTCFCTVLEMRVKISFSPVARTSLEIIPMVLSLKLDFSKTHGSMNCFLTFPQLFKLVEIEGKIARYWWWHKEKIHHVLKSTRTVTIVLLYENNAPSISSETRQIECLNIITQQLQMNKPSYV